MHFSLSTWYSEYLICCCDIYRVSTFILLYPCVIIYINLWANILKIAITTRISDDRYILCGGWYIITMLLVYLYNRWIVGVYFPYPTINFTSPCNIICIEIIDNLDQRMILQGSIIILPPLWTSTNKFWNSGWWTISNQLIT